MSEIVETPKYEFPAEYLDEIKEKVAKLNKRAAKLAVAPIKLVISPVYVKMIRLDGTKKTYPIDYVSVEIVGEPVKFAGWNLVARVDFGDGFPLIRTHPGFKGDVPEEFRTIDSRRCDHCGVHRARNDTFILVNEDTGAFNVVGRSCIRDFLGHDPAAIVAHYTFLDGLNKAFDDSDGEGGGGGWLPSTEITHRVLAVTSAVIRTVGWVPKSDVREDATPTAWVVADVLWPSNKYERERAAAVKAAMTPGDDEIASAVIKWATEDNFGHNRPLSDYEFNLKNLLSKDMTRSVRMSFVASAVAAYHRHLDKLEEFRRKRESKVGSVHVGEKGVRSEFVLTVDAIRHIDGAYGVITLITFSDDAGNVVKWFASNPIEAMEVRGAKFTVKATVKDHKEFNGIAETLLTRVSVVKAH